MSVNENTTTNGTQLPSCSYNPTVEKIGKTFAYCLIFVVSLAGNIFIGIIVYKTKTMRKPINLLIVNMAMSDLLFPIVVIPQKLTHLYVDSWLISGPLGQALCKLIPFLQDASTAVSIQSLVLIAVDRFGAVVFPLRSPLISSKLCSFFILATWIVGLAIYSPWLFSFKVVEYPRGLLCAQKWHEVFGEHLYLGNFILAIAVVMAFTPLVFIAILYTIICVKLKKKTIPGEQSANTRKQRVKRERNVLKMSIAIVVGFAVCWLPLIIYVLIRVFFVLEMQSCTSFWYFRDVALFMAYANCAINPCICFIFSANYSQALKNLLRCF